MAPKIKVAAGESRRALIVVLVFFILATIGAGLFGYYGYSEQDKFFKAAKEAERKEKVANEERDFYRYEASVLRAYLGVPAAQGTPTADELARKPDFDAGKLGATAKELPEFKEVLAKLNARLPWDNAKAAPKDTYESLIKALQAEIDGYKKEVIKANEEVAVARAGRTATQTDRTKDQAAFTEATDKVKKEFEGERLAFTNRLKELETLLKNVEDKKDETWIKPIVAENEKLKKDMGAMTLRMKALDEKIVALSQAAAATAESGASGKPAELTVRGKITRVHINPRKVTIDLGRVHGLTAQTTFAVHGYQANGKPRIRSKANIEVTNVGETSSDALITEIFHPDATTDYVLGGKRKTIDVLSKDNLDPVIAGDALINPAWNPNAKTHIVLAGLIDLNGTGALSLPSLVQGLERQNIIVDAYIDPVDGAIKGKGLSRRTDFVLLGTKPAEKGIGGAPRDDEAFKAMTLNYDKLINDAKQAAIPLKQPHAFFRETGFNLPRTGATD